MAVPVEDAIRQVPRGARVFVHGAAATPTPLLDGLVARPDLDGVTLYYLHTSGPAPFAAPEVAGRCRSVSFLVGLALRKPVAEGRADFMPIFLSQIPGLFLSGRISLDVALLSPPDQHGLCTLGTSVDAARAAVDHARLLIAEIKDQMPRTLGDDRAALARRRLHPDQSAAARGTHRRTDRRLGGGRCDAPGRDRIAARRGAQAPR